MKPVMQTISDGEEGDCQRATIASLFDLRIEQVPHFRLFDDSTWWRVYCSFYEAMGYSIHGTGYFPKFTPKSEHIKDCHVNGYLDATVPSRNFPGKTHSVVMDRDGLVVHDPSFVLENSYTGENVIQSGDLMNWILAKKT